MIWIKLYDSCYNFCCHYLCCRAEYRSDMMSPRYPTLHYDDNTDYKRIIIV